jgi:hypothetical protein
MTPAEMKRAVEAQLVGRQRCGWPERLTVHLDRRAVEFLAVHIWDSPNQTMRIAICVEVPTLCGVERRGVKFHIVRGKLGAEWKLEDLQRAFREECERSARLTERRELMRACRVSRLERRLQQRRT